jgi:hypothetical protein
MPRPVERIHIRQFLCVELFAKLVIWATQLEYDVKVEDWVASLSFEISLWKEHEKVTDEEAYRRLGEWWEKQHPLCHWGGHFKDPQIGRFTIAYQERKPTSLISALTRRARKW